jgi:uncharacterized membrane protein
MNTSAFWIIVLGIWIFTLQSKIKDLEKMVQRLLEGKKDSSKEAPLKDDLLVQRTEKKQPPMQKEEAKAEEYISAVAQFKTSNTIAKTTTRIISAKKELGTTDPSWLMQLLTNYFTGGNLLVRIGGIILFFGLAFLVKYAAEHSVISMQSRLLFIALAAIALIIVGWKLKDREGAYGQILQGLGIAMFYLVIYAASKFYAILSLDIAFALMLLVVIIGSVLAVKEDALPLALFSTAGGFLVPILTSSGEGSHVVLFSYYALLNLGIFVVAWYRSWRVLNVAGFLFTFVIATVWGVLRYSPELFSTTEPFLILYFLMYLTISILFTVKHPFKPRNFVDGTLVFGLPLVAFPLQVSLVKTIAYGEAYSAMVLGTLYALLAYWLRKKERTGLVSQSFVALSLVFYTIAIPYIFDADVSAALWSLESAAILWIALKQERAYARYFGELLLLLSIAVYPQSVHAYGISMTEYIGYIIVIVAALLSAYLLDTHRKQLSVFDAILPKILLGLSILLWFISTPEELMKLEMLYSNALLFSLTLAALLLFMLGKWLEWKLIIQTLQGYLPFGILIFFITITNTGHLPYPFPHPFEGFGALALGTFILFDYLFLYHYDKAWAYTKQIHILSLWFIAIILMLELRYDATLLDMGESIIAIAVIGAPLLFSIIILAMKKYPSWLEKYQKSYQLIAVGGLVFIMILWELSAFSIAPDFTVFAYVPLFNPLDAVQILGLGVIFYWIYRNTVSFSQSTQIQLYGLSAFMSLLLISVIFARAVHMFREVEYTPIALWRDIYFQTGISILWSLVAIVLMVLSKRYKNRSLWIAGFGLLILVVLKLFFVELASSGTIERIISFIVVGSLLLLIGYFVPLPPSEDEKVEE